jgi:hypothetical protein
VPPHEVRALPPKDFPLGGSQLAILIRFADST